MALTKATKVGNSLRRVSASDLASLKEGDNHHGSELLYSSTDTIETSFGTENTNGGASVFHNYAKGSGGSNVKGGLTGGYGARPFDGESYVPHSHVALHFLSDKEITPTNHGGWLRLLVTKEDTTMDNRIQALAVSSTGDVVVGADVPYGYHKMSQMGLGDTHDGRGLKQIVNETSEIHAIAPRGGRGHVGIVNFRGSPVDGKATPEGLTVGATQKGATVFYTMSGHNGAGFEAARGGMAIIAEEGWSTVEAPTRIVFSTTAKGSRDRKDRWRIGQSGTLCPMEDNVVDLGTPVERVKQIYAANSTINTSDARLKTGVRGFSEGELEAAKLLSKEIGFYQWIDRVAEKGKLAREHCGMTVQRAIEIMESCGLDPFNYGFICKDEWEDKTYVYADENGKSLSSEKKAGEVYSFRIDQLILFIARGFEARLSALESA